MTPTKEYQSNRNRYTKRLVPVGGRTPANCEHGWADAKGNCVWCGEPISKPDEVES